MIPDTYTHWGPLTALISADGVIWLSAAIRRLLKSADDNFLMELKGTLPDLSHSDKEERGRDVKITGSLLILQQLSDCGVQNPERGKKMRLYSYNTGLQESRIQHVQGSSWWNLTEDCCGR